MNVTQMGIDLIDMHKKNMLNKLASIVRAGSLCEDVADWSGRKLESDIEEFAALRVFVSGSGQNGDFQNFLCSYRVRSECKGAAESQQAGEAPGKEKAHM